MSYASSLEKGPLPEGVTQINKVPGLDNLTDPQGKRIYVQRYFFYGKKQPQMIGIGGTDKSISQPTSIVVYNAKLNPSISVNLEPTAKRDEVLKLMGGIYQSSKFSPSAVLSSASKKVVALFNKLLRKKKEDDLKESLGYITEGPYTNMWKSFDKVEKTAVVIYGTIIAIGIFLVFYQIIHDITIWAQGKYAAGPAERKLNQKLFVNQKGNESAYEMYAETSYYLKLLIQKKIAGLILCGPPGMSKTYLVRRTFHFGGLKVGKDYVIEKGSTLGLSSTYDLLYKNRKRILVLDDFDTPLRDPDIVNLLKAITDSYSTRLVSLPREKQKVHYNKDGGDQGLKYATPSKFKYEGQVVIITNLTQNELDQALKSRCPTIEMNFNSDDVLKGLKLMMEYINPEVPMSQKLEVFDYINKLYVNDKKITISFRTFVSAVAARAGDSQNWKSLVRIIVGYKGKPID